MPSHWKKSLTFAIIVYLLMVALATMLFILRRDALAFHTRDFNYFMEQAARLVDPGLSNEFALNIEGYNFLGLQGIEGTANLIHALHTSYFRYTYALLYVIFWDTLPIFIFYSAIFFLPILYIAHLTRFRPGPTWAQVICFTLLFVVFPATFPSVTADLRPRILFISAWSIAALAIYFDRPFWEKLLAFVFLLSLREEGVLFGAVLIVFNHLRLLRRESPPQPGIWRQTTVFSGLVLAAFIAFLIFMDLGGYTRVDVQYDPRNILISLLGPRLPLVIAAAAALLAILAWIWRKRRDLWLPVLMMLTYSGGVLLSLMQLLRDVDTWLANLIPGEVVTGVDIYARAMTHPATSMVFYQAILLIVLLLGLLPSSRRAVLPIISAVLGLIFTVTTVFTVVPMVNGWRENLANTRIIWTFKQAHDRYDDDVLTDYAVYQAFYDWESIAVYNRLPVWMIKARDRFYPKNRYAIEDLLQQGMDYVVISRPSLATITDIAQTAEVRLAVIAETEGYVILSVSQDESHGLPDLVQP